MSIVDIQFERDVKIRLTVCGSLWVFSSSRGPDILDAILKLGSHVIEDDSGQKLAISRDKSDVLITDPLHGVEQRFPANWLYDVIRWEFRE